jgi:hypothetical protein
MPGGDSRSVPCGEAIDVLAAPPSDLPVVLGVVALPIGKLLEVAASGETVPGAALFAKWGLVVRAGETVDLQVAPGWAGRAFVGWGSPASPAPGVRASCQATAGQGQWLAFAGGYWVDQPACLPLIVRSHGQQAQVQIGVGVVCPTSTAGR